MLWILLHLVASSSLACNNYMDYCDDMEHHLGTSSEKYFLINLEHFVINKLL